MSAADVGGLASGCQLPYDAIQGGQPRRQQACPVSRAKEPLRAVKQTGVVLAPLHAVARAEILQRSLADVEQVLDDRICPRQVDGPVRIRQTQRLLLRQAEASGGTVVFQVASGGLVGEPLANIALVSAGPLRQLPGGRGLLGQSPIQPQLIPQQHQYRTDRATQVPDGFAQKCVESLFVDGHVAPSRKRLQMWLFENTPPVTRGGPAVFCRQTI